MLNVGLKMSYECETWYAECWRETEGRCDGNEMLGGVIYGVMDDAVYSIANLPT